MQPYDDPGGHFREAPEETLVVVGMDLLSVVLVAATLAGFLVRRPGLLWLVVALGTVLVLWVVGIWSLVARWRDWE